MVSKNFILFLFIEVDIITREKFLGCILKVFVFLEKDIREGFEERFNIFVKCADTRVEYRIGS